MVITRSILKIGQENKEVEIHNFVAVDAIPAGEDSFQGIL